MTPEPRSARAGYVSTRIPTARTVTAGSAEGGFVTSSSGEPSSSRSVPHSLSIALSLRSRCGSSCSAAAAAVSSRSSFHRVINSRCHRTASRAPSRRCLGVSRRLKASRTRVRVQWTLGSLGHVATLHPFIRTDDGTAPGEAQECQSESAAIRRAEGMSRDPANAGAVAFKRAGDPNVGEFSDAVVREKFGDVPEDLSEL